MENKGRGLLDQVNLDYCSIFNNMLDNLSTNNIKNTNNLADLMRDNILVNKEEYDYLIKKSDRYDREYSKLRNTVRLELEEETRDKLNMYRAEADDLRREIRNLREDKRELEHKCDKLLNKVKEYEKTGWFKRIFWK